MTEFPEIWSYLRQGPLLWLTATLAAYLVGEAAFRLSRHSPLVNPVLVAMVLLAAVLIVLVLQGAVGFFGYELIHRVQAVLTVVLLATFVVFAVYGVLAAQVRQKVLESRRAMAWLRGVSAAAFGALGARLALSNG